MLIRCCLTTPDTAPRREHLRTEFIDIPRGLCSYVLVSEPLTPATLVDQYTLIMDGLCKVVAARAARFPYLAPVLLILWVRLRRSVARFASAMKRTQAGPAKPRTRPTIPPDPRPKRAGQRLPDNIAWVLFRVPEAAAYASQLQHLLARPEMARLVNTTPSLGRILRPLCRILGVPNNLPPPPPRPSAITPSQPPTGWSGPDNLPDLVASTA